jgi:3D (Asp-Asp-Asp) domain-containing protein
MLSNDAMRPNRYAHWARARRMIQTIQDYLYAGHTVTIATHTRATRYTRKHSAMFKATRTGAYVQRGKQWDCIDYCTVIVE